MRAKVKREVIFPFKSKSFFTQDARLSKREGKMDDEVKASVHGQKGSDGPGDIDTAEEGDRELADGVYLQSDPVNGQDRPVVPDLFTSLPPIKDRLVTDTSELQDKTVADCLPYLAGTANPSKTLFDFTPHGVPRLEREDHIDFLVDALQNARYMAFDASRPWVVYWALTGLSLLGEDVAEYQERVSQTFAPAQNPSGGFGGGHGQISHCAPSYAAILSLAMVGGTEALELIDRRSLWQWLGEVKQADGGFRMCVCGEEDVRGAYCSMTILSLLSLPLELPPNAPARANGLRTFLDGLPEYLSRCQTFEGGISGAPQTEAHGAYAFCALACLCILGPPHKMIPKYLDLPLLISWLSARQYAPEGGFSGRTNKLADGCYSHWVGGCWPLIEAALNGPRSSGSPKKLETASLYSRDGIIRYILSCCQADDGGLRDKPTVYPDAYHSCYTLAGLSSAQHYNYFAGAREAETEATFSSALHWDQTSKTPHGAENETEGIYDPEDRVGPIHPIYAIPWAAVERSHAWFSRKTSF